MPSSTKLLSFSLNIFLLFYFGLFFAQKINLTTADLGRHIVNGREILHDLKPIKDNHYSYTEQFFPTIMHHWGAGVIYYLAWINFDFIGVSLLHTFINGLAVLLFYLVAKNRSSGSIALLICVLTIPLISTRVEVRPEEFSNLFMGLYLLVLEAYRTNKLRFKTTSFILIIAQLLWVNMHIFFVFGFLIVGVYLLEQLLVAKNLSRSKQLITVLFALSIVSLLNPFGLQGLLEPFNIFKDYGYMIAENQSVFFMQKRMPQTMYIHFEGFVVLSLLLTVVLGAERRLKGSFVALTLTLITALLAIRLNRMIPVFGLFFVVFAAQGINLLVQHKLEKSVQIIFEKIASVLAIMLLIVSAGFPDHYYSPVVGRFGLGLADSVQESGKFFLERDIKGPVLNNYDIGGYLIFHLYPREKVFVDNRPEAYSVNFFDDIYVPMLKEEDVWKQKQAEYGFNAIFFYRKDITQWAQPFLINRIRDPEWIPVFVDDYVLILVRDDEQNREVIEHYRVPDGVFVVTS